MTKVCESFPSQLSPPVSGWVDQTIKGPSAYGVQEVTHALYSLYSTRSPDWKKSADQVNQLIRGWLLARPNEALNKPAQTSLEELQTLVVSLSDRETIHPVFLFTSADAVASWVASSTDLQIFEVLQLCEARPSQSWRRDAIVALLTEEQKEFIDILTDLHSFNAREQLFPLIVESEMGSPGACCEKFEAWTTFLKECWQKYKKSETDIPILQSALAGFPGRLQAIFKLLDHTNFRIKKVRTDLDLLLNIASTIADKDLAELKAEKKKKEAEAFAVEEKKRAASAARKKAIEKRILQRIQLLKALARLDSPSRIAAWCRGRSPDEIIDIVHFCTKVDDRETFWRLPLILKHVRFPLFQEIILSLDQKKHLPLAQKALGHLVDTDDKWAKATLGACQEQIAKTKKEAERLVTECRVVKPQEITPDLLDRIGALRNVLSLMEDCFSRLEGMTHLSPTLHGSIVSFLIQTQTLIAKVDSEGAELEAQPTANAFHILLAKTHGLLPSDDTDFFFGRLGRWGIYGIDDLHAMGLLRTSVSLKTHTVPMIWRTVKGYLAQLGIESERDLANRHIYNRATLTHFVASRQDLI